MNRPLFGLVCTGGGAHGAYQVGVLKYIHENFSSGQQSPFQIFTGSSCGALNTTFFAAQSFDAKTSCRQLEDLWLSFHVPGYHGNLIKNAFHSLYKEWRRPSIERKTAWALLDPFPMREIIERGFLRSSLERSIQEGSTRGAAIAATELISGRACWFQEGPASSTWNLFHSIGLKDSLTGDHLAASCSVPVFLPPVKIGTHYFLDGSVSLNHPLSAAIAMGATRILSIATDKPSPMELPVYQNGFTPRLTNVIRLLLNRLSYDSVHDEAVEINTFNRFYRALARKHRREHPDEQIPLFHEDASPSHYHPAELCLVFPSKRIREGLSLNGNSENTGRKKTRFMFHEKFIREMIDLGHGDAKSRHEELKNFFSPSSTHKRWFLFAKRKSAA